MAPPPLPPSPKEQVAGAQRRTAEPDDQAAEQHVAEEMTTLGHAQGASG
jgi:hypothetical protein